MDQPIARSPARPIRWIVALAALPAVLSATAGSAAVAQTLVDPNPPAKWSPPHAVTKSPSAAHVKSCSAFGAGFINLPGTDTCVKVGGFVSGDVAVSPGR
jgi:hypothetical protein